jgi:xylose isomerase
MNRLAIITAFLGDVKNRYMTYQPPRALADKLAMAAAVEGCDGVELCYPADFADPKQLKALLAQHGLGVSAVNFRSRRTGQWWRGSFSSDSAQERQEVVDDLRRAMDITAGLGCQRITTCPLNDGTDFPFEADPVALYDHAAETLSAACAHNRDLRIGLEFKRSDPRARSLFGTAGETAAFCMLTGADNLGATLDIGHALYGGESPAQAAALLARANRLFYVHLNDNDGHWDWDMIPGIHHTWAFVEFFYTLDKLGYRDDWYAFDVVVKEHDTVETFNTVMALTRQLEAMAAGIDREKMATLMEARDPGRTMGYLYGMMREKESL